MKPSKSIAMIYAKLIIKGEKTLDDVIDEPPGFKELVEECLHELAPENY